MHFSEKDDCNCVLCLELNGGEKYSCICGDAEEKIIVVEQPKKDRKLPFTYFGMEVDDSYRQEASQNNCPQKEPLSARYLYQENIDHSKESLLARKEENNEHSDGKSKLEETQLVSVELTSEDLDEEFVLEFLENNVINVVYKYTFTYAIRLIDAVQHEYYSEDDPPFYYLEDDDDVLLSR